MDLLSIETPTKVELANGLTIILKEIHSNPIVSFWTWYRVGMRNEKPGYTGISHWVEHMQFKGTGKFSANQMDRVISREGGVFNAYTSLDWTSYFATMPANKIDIALEIEADRMTNSLFDPSEVESERGVIIAEKEGKENEPFLRLDAAVNFASFIHHPYRNEIVGRLEDLNSLQRDDLYQYYQTYYQPSNALITIAGDFETKKMIKKLGDLFSIPTQPKPEISFIKPEYSINGLKEINMSGPGEVIFIQILYRAPGASDPDFFAYTILDSLLSGPASINMFGVGGISNKTSMLYRKLVDKRLAVSVGGGLQATIDPYNYEISLTLHAAQNPDEAIKTVSHQIEQLIERKIKRKDLERAVKQAKALFAYGMENITNQAFWLGASEMFADYSWYTHYLMRLNEITPSDIQKVAEKYLRPDQRVIGIYLPEENRSVQTE